MTVFIEIPFEMVGAVVGGGLGYELIITQEGSDDTHTKLRIPITDDWQLPYLQFIKNMLDKFDKTLKNK